MKILFNPIFLVVIYLVALILLGLMIYNKPIVPKKNSCEYQFIVTDDSITVYDGDKTIGTVKLEGQLDSLIIKDNE